MKDAIRRNEGKKDYRNRVKEKIKYGFRKTHKRIEKRSEKR